MDILKGSEHRHVSSCVCVKTTSKQLRSQTYKKLYTFQTDCTYATSLPFFSCHLIIETAAKSAVGRIRVNKHCCPSSGLSIHRGYTNGSVWFLLSSDVKSPQNIPLHVTTLFGSLETSVNRGIYPIPYLISTTLASVGLDLLPDLASSVS